MLTKARIEAFRQQLLKHQEKIANDRDALRALLDEFEDIIDHCQEADENLDAAVDALSRLQ